MKIYGIKDSKEFFKRVEQCKGSVKILTTEGDRLNLKSKLCQYIFLSELFNEKKPEIPAMELICENPDDVYMLVNFLISE